jgi:NAD+ kinase
MKDAPPLASKIADFLSQRKIEAVHGTLADQDLRDRVGSGEFDFFVAIGGDGTMLRAGHICGPCRVPILGINLGRFGFLMEVEREGWQQVIERVLEGDYWLEERMMLVAEQERDEKTLGSWLVLNECFVGRAEQVRPVRLLAEIDGRYLTTYVADGLIAATATGSTAYALAAGGPILPPQLRNILIVPVAPHLSVDRAVVLHEGSWVRITVRTDHQAILSADGQEPVPLMDKDHVNVRASEHSTLFARLQDPGYFYRNLTSRMNQNPSAEM